LSSKAQVSIKRLQKKVRLLFYLFMLTNAGRRLVGQCAGYALSAYFLSGQTGLAPKLLEVIATEGRLLARLLV